MSESKIWHPQKSVFTPSFKCGEGCTIHAPVWIGGQMGDNCMIEAFVFLPDWVVLGNNVFVGPHACFTNDKRPPSYGKYWEHTVVEDDVSVGAGAVILPGVILGKGCVIGAGAVVTKDVPAGEVWVGNPASKLDKSAPKPKNQPSNSKLCWMTHPHGCCED